MVFYHNLADCLDVLICTIVFILIKLTSQGNGNYEFSYWHNEEMLKMHKNSSAIKSGVLGNRLKSGWCLLTRMTCGTLIPARTGSSSSLVQPEVRLLGH